MKLDLVGKVIRTEILYGDVYSHGVGFDKNMLPSPIESVGVSISTKGEKLYDLGQKVVLTITTSDHVQTNNT
jgi:hypothetical protein